ncbi:LuxR C-terminal-related transcriptional regulator [Actinomycetospora sp. NBRC 106375]|uniref:helix-turn-helix transcriptional regulator n=1 Tax=Actinomycetospora sp. NBRC 106375 TaxID=3032207 RepID=UPI0025560B0A|nr:LuxR C-terminal-related transcriptional regulator [Actinomycetospora sp. NBRC 106375]
MGNLPYPLSGFVGRGGERRRLEAALAGARLVTVCGPGGAGKSRLALEVARSGQDRWAGGAWLVDLAGVADPGLVADAVGEALGVRASPGHSVTDALVDRLGPQATLLILDDCEHLVAGCGRVVVEILERCPSAQVLATSRRILGVDGEKVFRLGPLDFAEGRELFVRRARATGPEVDDDPAEVEAICRRLDGLPLAIELAAALRRVFGVAEIHDRLEDPLGVLAVAGGPTRSRHGSLTTAIGRSHELLPEPARTAFRRLGVFAGPFTAATAGAIGELSPTDVDAVLAELTASSLLAADTAATPTRYRMLDTVRAFAVRELEARDELAAARTAHCRTFLDLAERAEPALTGADQLAWLDRLQAEQPDLRAALSWATSDGSGGGAAALRLAAALTSFWHLRGSISEGVTWLRVALDRAPTEPTATRAAALWGLGVLGMFTGDVAVALPATQESLQMSRWLSDDRIAGRALSWLGQLAWSGGELDRAEALLAEAVPLARGAEDAWNLADAAGALGYVEVMRGDVAAAHAAVAECLTVARGAGNLQGEGFGLGVGAHLALAQGRLADAERDARAGLALVSALGGDYRASWVHTVLAGVGRRRGDRPDAEHHASRAHELAAAAGAPALEVYALLQSSALAAPDTRAELLAGAAATTAGPAPLLVAQVLAEQAAAALDRDDVDGAVTLAVDARAASRRIGDRWAESLATRTAGRAASARDPRAGVADLHAALEIATALGDAFGVIECWEALADVERTGPRVVRLLGAAAAHRERLGWCEPTAGGRRAAASCREIRAVLGDEAFDELWQQGRALSEAQATRLASGTRGPRNRPAEGWAALTPAEQQVARLAADGLTNSGIAEQLFVSPRTVQSHLARVFAKLGVTRRTELVVIVQRHGG